MFENILVATDGSENAQRAVRLAAGLAAAFQARLAIVNVVQHEKLAGELRQLAEAEHLAAPNGHSALPNLASLPGWVTEAMDTAANIGMEHDFVGAVAEHVIRESQSIAEQSGTKRIETIAAEGEPARAILRCARDLRADLIVLGSRGLGELKALLRGSVSHRVAKAAPCPCLLVDERSSGGR